MKFVSRVSIIGALARYTRRQAGIKQIDAARKILITQSTFSKIERGNVELSISKLLEMLDFYRVDPVLFFGRYRVIVRSICRSDELRICDGNLENEHLTQRELRHFIERELKHLVETLRH